MAALVHFRVADKGIGPMIQKRKNEITVVVVLSVQLPAPPPIVGVEPAHPCFRLFDEPRLILLADCFLGTGRSVSDCERSKDCRADRTHLEVTFWRRQLAQFRRHDCSPRLGRSKCLWLDTFAESSSRKGCWHFHDNQAVIMTPLSSASSLPSASSGRTNESKKSVVFEAMLHALKMKDDESFMPAHHDFR